MYKGVFMTGSLSIPSAPRESKLRVDYSRADQYIYPEAPKLSFFQKLGRGVLKGLSFLGPIGGAIGGMFAPAGIGIPVAMGGYGVGKLSSDLLANSNRKIAMQNADYYANMPKGMVMSGLFEAQQTEGEMATSFIAPPELHPQISDVIIKRNNTQLEYMHQMPSSNDASKNEVY